MIKIIFLLFRGTHKEIVWIIGTKQLYLWLISSSAIFIYIFNEIKSVAFERSMIPINIKDFTRIHFMTRCGIKRPFFIIIRSRLKTHENWKVFILLLPKTNINRLHECKLFKNYWIQCICLLHILDIIALSIKSWIAW